MSFPWTTESRETCGREHPDRQGHRDRQEETVRMAQMEETGSRGLKESRVSLVDRVIRGPMEKEDLPACKDFEGPKEIRVISDRREKMDRPECRGSTEMTGNQAKTVYPAIKAVKVILVYPALLAPSERRECREK